MDPFSPVAPAHIRVLVLPVGQIERHRFESFVRQLHTHAAVIPLADVPVKPVGDAFLLSPGAAPGAALLYRFSAALPSDQQLHLSPYEIFREPLLVLGLVDASTRGGDMSGDRQLEHAAAYLKERHPRVVHRQLLVLDRGEHTALPLACNAIGVSTADDGGGGHFSSASLRAAVCELSARFLVELTTYAKAMQASPSIHTPGQTARSLQRTTSMRENEQRPSSGGRSTPPNIASPPDQSSPASPPSRPRPPPATSFDQIPSANRDASTNPRSESHASSQSDRGGKKTNPSRPRSSSQDRVSVQGFGSSSTSQEKARLRGRTRVSIVLASIYMMAGHWNDALRMMVEHTTKARALSDHLWHAKGLENMMVCMILLAWSDIKFQVPALCDPVADRASAANAARIAAETKAAAEGTKQQLQLFRLFNASPELSRLILSLYRSAEGSLELPFLQHAEASIRFAKLLATLSTVDDRLTPAKLAPLIIGQEAAISASAGRTRRLFRSPPALGRAKSLLSKSAIAEILAQAFSTGEHGLTGADHIRVLAGVASSYAMLGLDRKKAITLKELITRLTGALIHARKVGAAEMGIHPAASLSTDIGTDTLHAIAGESGGINELLSDVSQIYGASLALQPSRLETPSYHDTQLFGNPNLKLDLLRELAGFCEASPDPNGVLLLTTSLLRAAGPNAAIDAAPAATPNALSREEQMHLAAIISRTVAISRHLGMTDAQAVYWDPFLVRDIVIVQPSGPKAVIDRAKLNSAETSIGPLGPGNPLLYDPNASRPGTAAKQTFVLIKDEASECLITLQNPFDIPIEIEKLELVTEGEELTSQYEPVTLGPMRFQHVSLVVIPRSTGSTTITGCRVKLQGCACQVFPIVTSAWSAKAPLTVKDLGLDARPAIRSASQTQYTLKSIGVVPDLVSTTIIPALPTLSIENSAILDSGLMLLEGERRSLSLVLRNVGSVVACIFDVADTSDVMSPKNDSKFFELNNAAAQDAIVVLEPGASIPFDFELYGKAGVFSTQINFYYCTGNSSNAKHARALSTSVDMTVNACVQVHHLEIKRIERQTDGATDEDALLIHLDIRNAWPKSVWYEWRSAKLLSASDDPSNAVGQLAPSEIRRLFLTMPRSLQGDKEDFIQDIGVVRAQFLRSFQVSWKVDNRSGTVDLQSLSLPAETIRILQGSPVQLSIDAVDARDGNVTVGSFITIQARLFNRTNRRSDPLYIALSPQASSDVAYMRDERRIAVAGTLHRVIPPLAGKASLLVEFVVCPLLAGPLDLEAVVRPTQIDKLHVSGSKGVSWSNVKSLLLTVHSS